DSRKSQDARNPKLKIRSLEIQCDTLEVHGQLKIPETNLTVYARKLVWGTAKASINSSPLPWAVKKAQNAAGQQKGENGAHGRHAGNIHLFIGKSEPADDQEQRLLACGGNGQDPGAGADGKDGESRQSRDGFEAAVKTPAISKAQVSFDTPAIYYTYGWYWSFIKGTSGTHTWGTDSFPTDGTDAVAPGKPGNAGNGGEIITTDKKLMDHSDNSPGKAGQKERDYRGGTAGRPLKSAKYAVKLYMDAFGTDNAGKDVAKLEGNHTTKSGTGAKALPADIIKGKSQSKHLDQAGLWIHPLQLQKVLEYARDLHLAGAVDDLPTLLADYEHTLSGEVPKSDLWNDNSAMQWARAASDIALILQRSRQHLDYYGHGAGFTPFLSLHGTVKLFEQEAERALHILLLTNWINVKARSVKEMSDILTEGIKNLNQNIDKGVEQIATAKEKITTHENVLESLRPQLENLAVELSDLENKLMDKARNDLEIKAMITAGIKMASAILKVIPVGQPALGAVGSLGEVAGDFIMGNNTAADAVSEMGGVFDKASKASKEALEAQKKLMEFKSKFPDEEVPGSDKKMLRKIGSNLGPALSKASEAIGALQVPESEVEAELKRLESESEEWNELTNKIRDLNERKTKALLNLLIAIEEVSEGYAKISSSTIAIVNFQKQKTEGLDKLNPEAVGCINEMEQEARHTLIYYLYLMVKAYETTILSPIDVNWKMSELTTAIQKLLQKSDVNPGRLKDQVHDLMPLYKNNINKIRTRLLNEFNFSERSNKLQIGLDADETPGPIKQLNHYGETYLDPVSFGLLLTDQQLARISDVNLIKVEFDPEGPPLPENSNVVISLQPDKEGTLRKSEKLYAVYSDQPISWSWTYIPSKKEGQEIEKSQPSRGAEDMFNFILGDQAGKVRQKMAYPPVWSRLKLKINFTKNFASGKRPRIRKLYLLFDCDSSLAPENQYVLKVEKLGVPAAVEVKCTKDLAGRANGLNNFYRIFIKNTQVSLSVPSNSDGAAFQSWTVFGNENVDSGHEKTSLKFSLSNHMIAQSHWDYMHQSTGTEVISRKALRKIAENHPEKDVRKSVQGLLAKIIPADLVIRLKPDQDAAVLGLATSLDNTTILEEGKDGWKQVNHNGIVGWVHVNQ
ncbi:MAG TPA: hypothetical protein DDW81_14145, partial [Cryomorphaceae bacterium]|nr:hypothetical protein [Cryomorphaceae bacterium]